MDDSRAEKTAPSVTAVPPYLVVLLIAAVAGVALMHVTAGTWHEAAANQAFPPDVRRKVAFAIFFNIGLAGAIALAAGGEIVATAVRLLRRAPVVPTAVRLGLALLLMVVLVGGHKIANPWLGDIVRAVRGATGGGGGQ